MQVPLRWVLVCFWLFLGSLRAAGPDDAFVSAYILIQTADTQKEQGQFSAAHNTYFKALEELKRFQKIYPTWNERVIQYRLRYVAERLEDLKSHSGTEPINPAEAAPSPKLPESVAPSGEIITQFQMLHGQIQRLAADRQLLEAKLREALAAQPVSVDPRELQRAMETIGLLQSTNKLLVAKLELQEAERRNHVDRIVAEETQRALSDANRQLQAQRNMVTSLTKQKDELDADLKRLQERELKPLKAENSTLKSQVSELKADTDRGKQIADLSARLGRLQNNLDTANRHNRELQTEKAALEKQIVDSQIRQSEEGIVRVARLESELAVARADAGRQTARAEELAFSLEKEKRLRQQMQERNRILEEKNRRLEQRIAMLVQDGSQTGQIVRTLQSALEIEGVERVRLETEVQEAEGRLASARLPLPSAEATLGEGGGDPPIALLASTGGWPFQGASEVAELRQELLESRAHEFKLQTALSEEQDMRIRLRREKEQLEERLALASSPTARSLDEITELEARVQQLEIQRDSLLKNLQALNEKSAERVVSGWIRASTPRERAMEFRNGR